MDTKFYYNIDVPVHPQFLIDKLQDLRYTNMRQSLLHVAIGVHCSLFTNMKGNCQASLQIINNLIKTGFTFDLTDAMNLTPIDYLFDQNADENAFC